VNCRPDGCHGTVRPVASSLHGGPDQALLTSWSINPSRGRTSRPETGGVTNAQVDPSGGCAASRRADSSPGSTVQATAGTEYRNFYPIFT